MGASKKKRGQQRKAAKKESVLEPVPEPGPKNGCIDFKRHDDGSMTIQPDSIAYAIQNIRLGSDGATNLLATQNINNFSFIDSGVLSVVLDFLNKCEDENFSTVVNDADVGLRVTLTYAADRLESPSLWIKILSKAVLREPSSSLLIAESIGPLVRCMCNDTERLFFKNNKHWKESIMPFVRLMSDMISKSIKSTDEEVVNTLLKYEGLLSSIVQWAFWNSIHRPDIIRVLGVDVGNSIITLGGDITTELILVDDNFSKDESGELTATKDGMKRLRSIGASSIASKDYDPTCTISFVAGFIRLLKDKGICHREPNSSILEHLIRDADCVDKDVITEVIDFGTNHVSDFESAEFAAKLSTFIICGEVGEEDIQSDARVSFTIRAGLIEMCLNFIRRFGWHESFLREKDGESLDSNIWYSLNVICEISSHKKTAKALRHKKDEIQNQLDRLKKIATNSTNVKILFDMVESVLENTGSYCCRCNKSLSRTEVKQCKGCGHMVYCSIACQREDWLNGHSVTCCKPYTDATAGQFQGRVIPNTTPNNEIEPILTYDKDGHFQGSAVQPVVPTLIVENERAGAKLVELEKNITSIQLKLFLDNSETILSQAKALNQPLFDCIVVFDLRRCFSRVKVDKYTDHYTPKAANGFRKSRSKENITCTYKSNIFNGTYAAKDDEDKVQIYNVPKLSMQKMFPHEWLLNQK